MDQTLKGLFGGGEESTAKAHDFVKRYQTGDPAEGYSDDEAKEAFARAVQKASPAQLQEAATRAVGQLSAQQRSDFAKMLEQRKAQGRASGHAPGSAASAGPRSGGPAIQHSSDQDATSGASSSGGLDDVLGGMLGGSGGGDLGDILGGILGGSAGTGGGLGDILGGLLGGQGEGNAGAVQQGQGHGDGADIAGMLSEFMSSPAGKAVIAGIGAFAMKEMLDNK